MFPAFSLPALLVALVATFSPGIVRDGVTYYSLSRPHPFDAGSVHRGAFHNAGFTTAILDVLEGPVVWHTPVNVPHETGDATAFGLHATFSYVSIGSLLNGDDDIYATCLAESVTVAFELEDVHTPFMIAYFQSDYSGFDFGTLTYDEHAFPAGVSFLLTGSGMRARVTWTLALFAVFVLLLHALTWESTVATAATSLCSLLIALGDSGDAEEPAEAVQRADVVFLLAYEPTHPANDIPIGAAAPIVETAFGGVLVADNDPTLPANRMLIGAPTPVDDLPVPPTTPVVEPACGELLDDDEPTFPFAGEDDIPIGSPAPIKAYTIELEHQPRGASAESFDTVTILLIVTYFFHLANDAGIQFAGGAHGMQDITQVAGAEVGAEGRRRREEARRVEVQTRMAATAAADQEQQKDVEPANGSLTPAVEAISKQGESVALDLVASAADSLSEPDASCITDVPADDTTLVARVAKHNSGSVDAVLLNDLTSLAALDLGGPSQPEQADIEQEPRCRSSRERTSTAPGHLPSAASRPASPAAVPRSMVGELGPQCLAALDLAGARKLDSDEQPSSPRTSTTTAPGYIPWAPARAPAAPVVPHALTPPPTAYARLSPYLIYETPRLEVICETSGTAPRPPPARALWPTSNIIYQTAPAPVVRALAARW
ncbi:hypothetical protein C8R43DRAFT_20677 [Mycena crocata]|nr:hypothetical protein C8R43DRAFT_20677 [Mycena crocata]